MRFVGASLAVTVMTLGAAYAFEQDQSRPGGVYTKVAASTPQACARACEDDNLCMAWTMTTQSAPACELKAVIPNPQPAPGMVSGVSSRAPRLLRLIPQANPLTPPTAPTAVAMEPQPAPAPAPAVVAETTAAPTEAVAVVSTEAPVAELAAAPVAEVMNEPAAADIAVNDSPIEAAGGSGLATLAETEAPVSAPDVAPAAWDVVDLTAAPESAPTAATAPHEATPTPRARPSSLRMGR